MQFFVLSKGFSKRILFIIFVLTFSFINPFAVSSQANNSGYSESYSINSYSLISTSTSYQDNYDVLEYDINLKIKHTEADKIRGIVELKALMLEDNVNRIQINLNDNMIVDSVFNESGRLDFEHSDDLITVTLEKTYNSGETVTVSTAYRGFPELCGFQGFNVEQDDILTGGQLVISTLSEPECARSWWPCKDRIDDKADFYNIAIQVDSQFYCVSNGKLDSVIAVGDTANTFYYTVKHPMTTYNFAMAISDFVVWEDQWLYNDAQDTMPIYHYVFKSFDSNYRKKQWGKTGEVLTFLSDWFGLYPFADEKYGHAQYQAGVGMEHQTISFMPGFTSVFDNPKYLVHELTHQWWGNMITCKSWGHLWIQEGLATYAEALYFEHTEGWKKYHKHMNDKRCEKSNRSVFVEDETDFDAVFDTNFVYNKGAWVMHMLRRKLGDDLFKAGLRAFTDSEFKYGSATTENMRDVFEDATGYDLHKFFSQWIYGKGLPVYEYSYWQGPSDPSGLSSERVIYLYVEQIQDTYPDVFEMPVDFVFDYKSGGSDTVTLEVNDRVNRFVVKVKDEIDTVKLDPMNWVLQKNQNTDWRMRIVTLDIPEIPDIALDTGMVNSEYNDTILTSSGFGQAEFSKIGGDLPEGLEISSEGVISGTCYEEGRYDFIISAKDLNNPNLVDTAYLSLTIVSLPEKFSLYQNYPNPFNNGTIISFDLPAPGNVTLEVYNILGQKVATLVDEYYPSGYDYKIHWQGKSDHGIEVSTGIYLYRLQTDEYISTRKMLLLK